MSNCSTLSNPLIFILKHADRLTPSHHAHDKQWVKEGIASILKSNQPDMVLATQTLNHVRSLHTIGEIEYPTLVDFEVQFVRFMEVALREIESEKVAQQILSK